MLLEFVEHGFGERILADEEVVERALGHAGKLAPSPAPSNPWVNIAFRTSSSGGNGTRSFFNVADFVDRLAAWTSADRLGRIREPDTSTVLEVVGSAPAERACWS